MKPRSLEARLERLEATRVDRHVPVFWVLTAPEELVTEIHGCGKSITRQEGEPWETFRTRAMSCIPCPCLTATAPMTGPEWDQWSQTYNPAA